MADYFTTYEKQCLYKGRIAGLRAAGRAFRLKARAFEAEAVRHAKLGFYLNASRASTRCEQASHDARWCEAEIRRLGKEARCG